MGAVQPLQTCRILGQSLAPTGVPAALRLVDQISSAARQLCICTAPSPGNGLEASSSVCSGSAGWEEQELLMPTPYRGINPSGPSRPRSAAGRSFSSNGRSMNGRSMNSSSSSSHQDRSTLVQWRGPNLLSSFGKGWKVELSKVHVQGFAAKGRGGSKSSPPAAAAAPKEPNPYAPPVYKVPKLKKDDPLKSLPDDQVKLLEALAPPGAPLTSLRQLGWPLDPPNMMALLHEQLSDANNQAVAVVPLVVGDLFASALTLVQYVRDLVEAGMSWSSIEQYFVQVLAGTPEKDRTFQGIKIQIKGRIGGKAGGKAGKKVWLYGSTGTQTIDDYVDFARMSAETRMGLVGVKVWIVYKRDSIGPNYFTSGSTPSVTLSQVLDMPREGPPRRSISAWWSKPGPQQPYQHRAWECFHRGYDPVGQVWLAEGPREREAELMAGEAVQGQDT